MNDEYGVSFSRIGLIMGDLDVWIPGWLASRRGDLYVWARVFTTQGQDQVILAFEDSLQPSSFLAHEFRAPGSRREFLEKDSREFCEKLAYLF